MLVSVINRGEEINRSQLVGHGCLCCLVIIVFSVLVVKQISKKANQCHALPAGISKFREIIFIVDKYVNCVQINVSTKRMCRNWSLNRNPAHIAAQLDAGPILHCLSCEHVRVYWAIA